MVIPLIRGALKIERCEMQTYKNYSIIGSLKNLYYYPRLSRTGRQEHHKDRRGLPLQDPDIEAVVDAAVNWLMCAQDNSASQDGGVSEKYHLVDGWADSYPETTGYIIPTLLDYSKKKSLPDLRNRARRMLDWLVSIQLPEGAFQGGTVNARPKVPVAFNTGQILLGLASGVKEFGEGYRDVMIRTADWLIRAQDEDGCWRKDASALTISSENTYDTHIAWSLLEVAKIENDGRYAEAALKNVRWALGYQSENGWFDKCCVTNPVKPLTHTLGYVFRGLLEAYLYTGDNDIWLACQKIARGLISAMRSDGCLPGRLTGDWRPGGNWSCLTGTAQIAYCWLKMHQIAENPEYLQAGFAANQYVRRTVSMDGPEEIRGAVKGSFPVFGGYCPYAYPNWGGKFFIDANLLEKEIREKEGSNEH